MNPTEKTSAKQALENGMPSIRDLVAERKGEVFYPDMTAVNAGSLDRKTASFLISLLDEVRLLPPCDKREIPAIIQLAGGATAQFTVETRIFCQQAKGHGGIAALLGKAGPTVVSFVVLVFAEVNTEDDSEGILADASTHRDMLSASAYVMSAVSALKGYAANQLSPKATAAAAMPARVNGHEPVPPAGEQPPARPDSAKSSFPFKRTRLGLAPGRVFLCLLTALRTTETPGLHPSFSTPQSHPRI